MPQMSVNTNSRMPSQQGAMIEDNAAVMSSQKLAALKEEPSKVDVMAAKLLIQGYVKAFEHGASERTLKEYQEVLSAALHTHEGRDVLKQALQELNDQVGGNHYDIQREGSLIGGSKYSLVIKNPNSGDIKTLPIGHPPHNDPIPTPAPLPVPASIPAQLLKDQNVNAGGRGSQGS